jgi:hypothetical protein
MSQVFTYDVVTLIELIESKSSLWDKTRGYVFKERVKASFQISYSQHLMYPALSFAYFVFSPKIQASCASYFYAQTSFLCSVIRLVTYISQVNT